MKRVSIILFLISFSIVCVAQNKAHIEFENVNHDYGDVIYNQKGDFGFVFKNSGNAPLVINEVVTSCGCTAVSWPKKPIPVDGTDSIVIKYDTKRIGVFNKSVIVKSNADNSNVTLTIKGNVLKKK